MTQLIGQLRALRGDYDVTYR